MFKKSEFTKERLYQIAVDLFAKKGFEGTTMRAIAAEAGVAPGAAYYYFASKESIIFEYYKQSHADHLKALENFLDQEASFAKRLHRVVTSKIEVAEPYKAMAVALFRTAANPKSPMSPFSEESKDLRLESLDLFKRVVEGSRDKFLPDLRELLPHYLWLYQMGIILFWIYDGSLNSKRTFELIDKTVPMIENLNQMIQSPLAVPIRKKIIGVLKNLSQHQHKGVFMILTVYAIYIAFTVGFTYWVGRNLFTNGRVFLMDSFQNDATKVDSINQLLLVGFYLVNFGLVLLFLSFGDTPKDGVAAVEYLAAKIGVVLMVLGGMHYFNMRNIAKMSSKARAKLESGGNY